MKLDSRIEEALREINFVKRYQKISQTYNREEIPSRDRLIYIDGEIIMEIIKNLGYKASFNSKEKFFLASKGSVDNFDFSCNIVLFKGIVQLVWVVRESGEVLLGSPLSTYAKRLENPPLIVKDPVIRDYEDLEGILTGSLHMFDEFQAVLINE